MEPIEESILLRFLDDVLRRDAETTRRSYLVQLSDQHVADTVIAHAAGRLNAIFRDYLESIDSAIPEVSCSFCRQHETRVGWLVQGPSAIICDECIAVCANEVRRARRRTWLSRFGLAKRFPVRKRSAPFASAGRAENGAALDPRDKAVQTNGTSLEGSGQDT